MTVEPLRRNRDKPLPQRTSSCLLLRLPFQSGHEEVTPFERFPALGTGLFQSLFRRTRTTDHGSSIIYTHGTYLPWFPVLLGKHYLSCVGCRSLVDPGRESRTGVDPVYSEEGPSYRPFGVTQTRGESDSFFLTLGLFVVVLDSLYSLIKRQKS